jgi:hypothetical protein
MEKDVAAYMRYYNLERPHTANDESPLKNCPVELDQYIPL